LTTFNKDLNQVLDLKTWHAVTRHFVKQIPITADDEFGCSEDHLKAIHIEHNFCAAQVHVSEIERLVGVVKERHCWKHS